MPRPGTRESRGSAAATRCAPRTSRASSLCRAARIDLAVIGPEAPLVAGVADVLRHAGVAVFGPSAAAARIEGSKSFAKEVMRAAGVPAAAELDAPRAPVRRQGGRPRGRKGRVRLPHAGGGGRGRAAGARVRRRGGRSRSCSRARRCRSSRSATASDAVALPAAQDYKRMGDGDNGPNTGGMGAYSPVPRLGPAETRGARRARSTAPSSTSWRGAGAPFVGLLYAGLMLTEDGPRVLEFNCRFGDPETQAILPLLDGDLLEPLAAAAAGDLRESKISVSGECAVTVVLASRGYPEAPEVGAAIGGTRRGGGRRRPRLPRGHGAARRRRGQRGRPRARRHRARRELAEARDRAYERSSASTSTAPVPARHRREGGQCFELLSE